MNHVRTTPTAAGNDNEQGQAFREIEIAGRTYKRPEDPHTFGLCFELVVMYFDEIASRTGLIYSMAEVERMREYAGLEGGTMLQDFGPQLTFLPICEAPDGHRWDVERLRWVAIEEDDTDAPEATSDATDGDSLPPEAKHRSDSPAVYPVSDPHQVLTRGEIDPTHAKFAIHDDAGHFIRTVHGFDNAQHDVQELNAGTPGRYSLQYAELQPPKARSGSPVTI